ncbi:MAG TPA: DUF72 domain-containing protein [Burkholderiaceae bacterium]
MQDTLFPEDEPPPSATKPQVRRAGVRPVAADPELAALARRLPPRLRIGTSSWHYPGWAGLVWDGVYDERELSRNGLLAYAAHPLLRTVCIDRSFYRPLTASQYARYAAQVPEDFRFVVKAPALVADALVRAEDGRGRQPNPAFLDPTLACREFVEPALEGLGARLGALVFEISPLPAQLLAQTEALHTQLSAMLRALPPLRPTAPDGVVAVEVRNPALLSRRLADTLGEAGASFCLGLHAKMPPIDEQLPMLRALWPGPLVCRWNLNRLHGAYGYEQAQRLYQPYDRLQDPDLPTRETLARVMRATVSAGQPVYVTVSNKAEGSAPLTVAALARLCASMA